MDLRLTEDQADLVAVGERLLEQRTSLHALTELTVSERGYDDGLFGELAGLGWLELADLRDAPGSYVMELGLVVTLLGKFAVPGPFRETAEAIGGLSMLREPSARAAGLLADAAAGAPLSWAHTVAAFVAVEAGADGRPRYRARGALPAVRWAAGASAIVVAADIGGPDLAVFALARDAVTVTRRQVADYERVADIVIDTDDLGEPLGWLSAEQAENLAALRRLLAAAELLGVGERALAMSLEHVKAREQFGRPVGTFQAVQHQCADMYIDLDAARLLIRYALFRFVAGVPYRRNAEMAAWFMGAAAERITRTAHQVHGGVGVIKEHPLHHLSRRAKTEQLRMGSRRVQARRVADAVVAAALADFTGAFLRWPGDPQAG